MLTDKQITTFQIFLKRMQNAHKDDLKDLEGDLEEYKETTAQKIITFSKHIDGDEFLNELRKLITLTYAKGVYDTTVVLLEAGKEKQE